MKSSDIHQSKATNTQIMKTSIFCILAAVLFVSINQQASGKSLEGNWCLWGYYDGKKCPERPARYPPVSQKQVDGWSKDKSFKPIYFEQRG